jgi:DNA repair protein RadC
MERLREILKEESIEYIIETYPNLRSIINASELELSQITGLTKSKAKQLFAYMQLSKILLSSGENNQRVSSPNNVYEQFKDLALCEEERMYVVLLDTKNNIVDSVEIAKGTLNSCIVHPREFYSPAIRLKANSVLAIHNHPSGDPTPSIEDLSLTKRLKECGVLLGIPLIDHIIIGNKGFTSLKEEGEL